MFIRCHITRLVHEHLTLKHLMMSSMYVLVQHTVGIVTTCSSFTIVFAAGTNRQLVQAANLSLQADWASLSRACPLLVACACPDVVYICIVFINTSYKEKIPKHGHHWRSASTSRSSVAGPGRALRLVLSLWLPCILPPALPLALAAPNAKPSNTGHHVQVQPGRAYGTAAGPGLGRPAGDELGARETEQFVSSEFCVYRHR